AQANLVRVPGTLQPLVIRPKSFAHGVASWRRWRAISPGPTRTGEPKDRLGDRSRSRASDLPRHLGSGKATRLSHIPGERQAVANKLSCRGPASGKIVNRADFP